MTVPSDHQVVSGALENARSLLARASAALHEDFRRYNDEGGIPVEEDQTEYVGNLVETVFLQLAALCERFHLMHLHTLILSTYEKAKTGREGCAASDSFEDFTVWLVWETPLNQFIEAIAAAFGVTATPATEVRLDLLTILRNTQKAVLDELCYDPPENEADVHDRIENVLRCFFPDLIRKPPLAKAISGFIPDTGIPSINTLVEYKYMSDGSQARAIANQILSDTRGYAGCGWTNIVFVIYETGRFRTVDEWRQLLRECEVPESIELILLHGVPPKPLPAQTQA